MFMFTFLISMHVHCTGLWNQHIVSNINEKKTIFSLIDMWRHQCHHMSLLSLFKNLSNINIMFMLDNPTIQEGDWFFILARNLYWWEICIKTSGQKHRTIRWCYLDLVEECHYPQGKSPLPTEGKRLLRMHVIFSQQATYKSQISIWKC